MCGIAGSFLQETTPHTAAALALLAVEMESRGDQAWGSFDGRFYEKNVGPITGGFSLPNPVPANFVMHTRFATHGSVSRRNSHPFHVTGKLGELVGVHNGVLANHFELNTKYGRKHEVDSEHIFSHLVEGLPLDDLVGYGAIVYWLNGEWHIGTFNGGSMEIVKTPFGLFFASTRHSINYALGLAGVGILGGVSMAPNTIYRVVRDGLEEVMRIDAAVTSLKWDDKKTYAWNKQGKLIVIQQEEEEEKEEEDDPDFGIGIGAKVFCNLCGMWIPEDGRVYRDAELRLVCEECAEEQYAFIDAQDYSILTVDELTRDGALACESCENYIMGDDPVFSLHTLKMNICRPCFEKEFSTKGLDLIDDPEAEVVQ